MSEMGTAIADQQSSVLDQMKAIAHEQGRKVLAIGAGLVMALGASACGGHGNGLKGSENASNNTANDVTAGAPCGDLTLANTAFLNYKDGKFLPVAPAAGISKPDEAAAYSQSLSDEDGPLSGKADAASLAVIDAAIATPASSSNTNNSYSYVDQFNQDMAKLESSRATARKTAVRLCLADTQVLGYTVGYDDNAIAKGEQYTTFTAVNGVNRISRLRLDHHTNTADHTISGITYRVQNQGNDNKAQLNGFTEVIVEDDGTMDVQGWLPTGGQAHGHHGKGGDQPSKAHTKAGHGHEQGGGHQTQSGGTSGTSNGERQANAESPHPGTVPERQQHGSNPGAHTHQGGPAGTRPGKAKSPNSGGGGGHEAPPAKPAPTQPPAQTTPEAPPAPPSPPPVQQPGKPGSPGQPGA